MKTINGLFLDKAKGIKKAKWHCNINKPNKSVGNIGKRDFLLFVQLADEYRENQRHNEQHKLGFKLQ
ncbi:hypothetical protein D3C87_1583750 [compost metagenome]